ncbi:O-antigen ligase family protein [Methylophilaceae bacterium]|nr:O-antigen ligase family protein [Methylophilaceae bacterium]
MLAKLKNYFPYLLPLLLIFSRAVADITIVIISILFLYYSFKQIGWGWVKQKWFLFAIFFSAYCLTINSALSIDSLETFAYGLFFLRWPIFSMALAYWILSDLKSLKKFLISLTLFLLFIIFDTWWQFFFEQDLFGFEKWKGYRLTGPFKGNPEVGTWLAKLILLPPLLLILYDRYKLQIYQNRFIYAFFIISTIVFLTIFITGERMQLLLILASILIFFLGLISEKIFSLKKIYLFLILSISVILIFSITFPETTQIAFFSTIEKIINWRSSDYGLVWQSAYDVWIQSPLFGVGLHKYREACVNLGIYGTSQLSAIGPGVCSHPHNISLQLLSETGIFGFIVFYLMVFYLAISSIKKYFKNSLWLPFVLTFNIIFTCFLPIASSTSFFSNKYGTIVWLLIGVMLAVNKQFESKK